MYINRSLENRVKYMADHFLVILVSGARQVGKTTLLKKKWNKTCRYHRFYSWPENVCSCKAIVFLLFTEPNVETVVVLSREKVDGYIEVNLETNG